ncbi:hypothetical protein BY996DRAFT_6451989 [Phakopsora pachyrhizi]|uniref:Uncharacterized protein n=1 Tax=Phakopsora pachyrhizi TaxID=170000 RepID=A0AAV0AWA8_PHAPC|nr:hypothetical protein BY996DRAFT_6451989 [Phakopsora pachyrhizi]CAH7673315.1 hypothetical protein PPACK8108_LOCUS8203 [Phakopsora pachyrhizi]
MTVLIDVKLEDPLIKDKKVSLLGGMTCGQKISMGSVSEGSSCGAYEMASDDDKDRMIANLQWQLAAATIGDDSFKTPFYKWFMKDSQGVAKDTNKLQRDGSNFVDCLLLAFPNNNCFPNDKNNFDNLLKHEELAVCHLLKTRDECSGKELLQLLETECYGTLRSQYLELTRQMLDMSQLTDKEQSITKWNNICAVTMESKLSIDQMLGLLIQATIPPPSQYQADLFHQNIQAILDRKDHIAGYRRATQVIREELRNNLATSNITYNEVLDLVVSDVMGPIDEPGCPRRFFLTLWDHSSTYTLATPLNSRSDVKITLDSRFKWIHNTHGKYPKYF